MKKVATAILLLLISGVALASNTSQTGFNIPSTDLSVNFLGQVFGTVGNVLNGDNGQMLGHIFDIFSKGILIVMGLYIGYIVLNIVGKASQHGSFMGQNRNVAFLLLRIAIGVAITIPSPSSGYSFSQDLVMKTIVEGVGLADQVWDGALNYMKDGGVLYTFPVNNRLGSGTAKKILNPARQVFADEVCMYESNYATEKSSQQARGGSNNNSGSSPYVNNAGQTFSYHAVLDSKNSSIYFPGYGDSPPFGSNTVNCGYVSAPTKSKNKDSASSKGAAEKAAAWAATQQMVTDLAPAARRYACTDYSNLAVCSGAVRDNNLYLENSSNMFSALMGYYNLITPYARMRQNEMDKSAMDFMKKAEAQGWIMAGRYYWDVARVDRQYDSVSVGKDIPYNEGPNRNALQGVDHLWENIQRADKRAANKYLPRAIYLLHQFNGTTSSGGAGEGSSKRLKVNKIVDQIFAGVPALFNDFAQVSPDPMKFLMKLGHDSLTTAVGIWMTGLVVIVLLAAVAGTCDSVSPGGVILNQMVAWIKPVALAVAGILFIPGIILGYYLPLYPYVLFTFAAGGWLVMCVESMAAIILVGLGLTHPEGHDLLGKVEQAVMLLLSIFLRPVLLVIGLIAGMILSYVMLRLIVFGFSAVIIDIFSGYSSHNTTLLHAASIAAMNGSPTPVHLMVWFIVFPVMLMIVSLIIYKMVQFIYRATIITMPTKITQWIGIQSPSYGEGEAALGVGGAVSGGAARLGEAGGTMTRAGMNVLPGYNKQRQGTSVTVAPKSPTTNPE